MLLVNEIGANFLLLRLPIEHFHFYSILGNGHVYQREKLCAENVSESVSTNLELQK